MIESGCSTDLNQIDRWLENLRAHRSNEDVASIRRAMELAQGMLSPEATYGQPRVLHLLDTAHILEGLKLDTDSLVANFLAEVPNNDAFDSDVIATSFGEPVLRMVLDLHRITKLAVSSHKIPGRNQLENLRRMLLGLADDVRVVLIVLARRLQKMRTLKHYPPQVQQDVANEALRVHAPLANRLGIWQLKWELEDLAFRYTEPETYQDLARSLEAKRKDREVFIQGFIDTLQAMCQEQGITADISGRPKHIYSIWKKMQRKQVEFAQIYDIRAVRVQVENLADCYQVLGMVHGSWRPVPGEFDDYIARPKANGYQSLHTAVIGDDGISMEVQVRTVQMHELAERGVAAHWRYKESSGENQELERRIAWMRGWLEDADESVDPDPEFEARTIYVLTPQGKVVELPRGATAIDFAYAIHSDVGHHCRGAKADGRIIPLTRPLISGETIEVLTTKEGGPSRDWLTTGLEYVVTARARNHIKQWFKRQDYQQHLQMGRTVLDREINRLGSGHVGLEQLIQRFSFTTVDDLLAAIGRGDLSPQQVIHTQLPATHRDADVEIPERVKKRSLSKSSLSGGKVMVEGVGDLMTQMAGCCKPVPYDPIVGYITRGRGITVHRENCALIARMSSEQQQRLIPVSWSEAQEDGGFLVDIAVYAWDRKDLLRDITSVFSNDNIAVTGVNTQSDKQREKANMLFSVEIKDMAQLSIVLHKIAQVPDVYDVKRQS